MANLKNSYYRYVEFINNRMPFSLTRYGDGEFGCMMGERGETCDGQNYTKQLKIHLNRTIENPILKKNYYYGMVRIARIVYGQKVDKFLKDCPIQWVDGTGFVDASRDGILFPLFEALRDQKIMIIGSIHLAPMYRDLFKYQVLIPVLKQNAYMKRDTVKRNILASINEVDLLAFSTGPMTEVLIHELYKDYGQTHTMIDFGSLWDVFMDKQSRRYMNEQEWQRKSIRNLTGE